jgi:hypothetical protein
MTWKDLNVFQWQQLNDLFLKSKDVTDLDLAISAASICTGLTEHEIDSLPVSDLNPLLKAISFIHEELKPQPERFIKLKGKRYKCIYDVRKIPAARYIETKHFGKDVNANLHRIAACMVMPMKRTLFGWKVVKYDASRHEEYSQDILEAPITQVLGSVVFFYQVYRNWIKSSKDYLIREMMENKLTRYQAEAVHQSLCSIMDGYTKPNWLLHSKESRLKRLMSYLLSNSLMTSLILNRKANTKQTN